jgi:allophanate hydrolase subunit 2
VISVVSWGVGSSVVDGGRTGLSWLGQSRGGAVDVESLSLANRLVGNPVSNRGIETSGGVVMRISQPTMLAVTGALADLTVSDGLPVGWGNPVVLPAGAQLRVGRLLSGARLYIGVRGGITRSEDDLIVGPDPSTPAATEAAPRTESLTRLRVWPGPRVDWFVPDAWSMLVTSAFEVTSTSRVGVRLAGPALLRAETAQLPSEGLVEGAIQVPPDGQPIIMLADHPTTGGYPVIAVIDPADLHHVAQAAPGSQLRFTARR